MNPEPSIVTISPDDTDSGTTEIIEISSWYIKTACESDVPKENVTVTIVCPGLCAVGVLQPYCNFSGSSVASTVTTPKMHDIAGISIGETYTVVPPLNGPSVGERNDFDVAFSIKTTRLDLNDLMPSKDTLASILPEFVNKPTPENLLDEASGLTGMSTWPNTKYLGAEITLKPKSTVNSVRSNATNLLGDNFREPRK